MAKLSDKLMVAGSAAILNQFKEEIAAELGIQLGSDTSARLNGAVGGKVTQRLVEQAKAQLNGF